MEIPFGTQEEQLEAVNKAIYTILVGGQSYKIGSRSLTRADLSELYAMQKAPKLRTMEIPGCWGIPRWPFLMGGNSCELVRQSN